MNLLKNTKFTLIWMLISAAILILAFPKFNFFPFAWVALVPFILVLRNSAGAKGPSLPRLFIYSFIAQIFFNAFIFQWMYLVAREAWFVAVIIYSFNFAFFAAIAAYFYKSTKPENFWARLLFIPSAYVLVAEYMKTLKPLGMSCGILASSQCGFLPILQISDIFGAFGVSWLIVFFNTYLAEMVILHCRGVRPYAPTKKNHIIIPPLVIVLCLVYGFYRLNEKNIYNNPLKVSIIQPNINQNVKWDKRYFNETLNKLFSLSRKSLNEKPDLVIWPETALPDFLIPDTGLFCAVKNFVNANNFNLLTGGLDYQNGKSYNASFLIMPNDDTVHKYAKMRLFPMGEYNPLKNILPKWKILELIGKYSEGGHQTVFDVNGRKFSTLICFESIFSYIPREAALRGADFWVLITNDAWFGFTNAPEQHLALSRLRSIENRMYMVMAANTGYSAFIDPCGRIVKKTRLFTDDVLTDNVYIAGKRSIFTRFGEWFILACVVVVLVCVVAVAAGFSPRRSKL